jgi:hypothetical protein
MNIMSESIKYRLVITEYTTLKGFGSNCSIEKEFDSMDSAQHALDHSISVISKYIIGARTEPYGNIGYRIIDKSTNLVLTSIVIHPYLIIDDGKEYLYRGHKIATEFDTEIGKDVLLIHRLDGRPYLYRSNIMGALDAIDWMWCSAENSAIARSVMTNKEDKGEMNYEKDK